MYQELLDVHAASGAQYHCSAFGAYAWPGGYPLVYVTDDGAALCPDCVNADNEAIGESNEGDGWHVTAVSVLWETDGGDMFCDHCSVVIESAYGEVVS